MRLGEPVTLSERNSTAPAKPSKPYPELPLFPRAAGYRAKKIRGKMPSFGPWVDADADALTMKDAAGGG